MVNGTLSGIVMATRLEAEPFLASGLFSMAEEQPFHVYRCGGFFLILSGIGKANAAIAATYLITKYNTETLYNIGAAGSTTDTLRLGDILHVDRAIDYDRPALITMKPRYLKPDTFEGYRTAVLATQDVAVVTAEDREKVGRLASLVDMEGAAFIQACRIFKVKNYLFKIVTDTPSHTEDRQIIDNIKETRELLYRFFLNRFITGTS